MNSVSPKAPSRLLSLSRSAVFTVLLSSIGAASLHAVTPALAHWTFDTGTSADLTTTSSTVGGGLTLTSANSGTVTYNSGYVSLANTAELIATGINTTTFTGLTSAVSMLVTMRFDAAPQSSTTYTAGFLSQTSAVSPQGFPGQTLVVKGSTTQNIGAYAYVAPTNGQFFNPSSGSTTQPIGTWFTMALTFNAGTVKGYLNGTQIFSTALLNGGTSLQSISSFGFGRVFNGSNGIAASYADIQVYDSALSGADVSTLSSAALATTAIPEPGSLAALTGLAVLSAGFMVRRRGGAGRRIA